MKFSIQRDEIYEALQKVVSVIPQRSTISMTQNVLLVAEDGQVELATTDLEITMISHVKADITEAGSVAIPGRQVYDLIREMPNLPLTFAADSNFRLELRSDFGQYKIGGENPAEFPQRPVLGEGTETVLGNETLHRLIEKTSFACSTDELRPALTGVFYEIGEGAIQAVATDGHRLGLLKFTDSGLPADQTSCIISTRALNFVLRSLEGDGVTAITIGDKHALFHMNNTQLYARLIEDNYVNYQRVIPEETNFTMVIDTAGLLASVRRVSLFSNPITAQVVLKIDKDRVRIEAEDIDYGGEANEEIPCEFSGEDFVIGFNSRYLQDILKHADSGQIEMHFVRPDSAVVVRPSETVDNEDQLMLLMPIRLDS